MADAPALVVCAHGTDDPDGRATTLAIAAAAAARLPGVAVSCAYVDVQEPRIAAEVDRLVDAGARVVVVPILLTLGYHTEVDVTRAVARHPGRAVSLGPLGPHPLLADVVVERLREAGAGEDDPVALAVAGSSRDDAVAAAREACALVQERWSGPVALGFLAAREPRLRDVVRELHGAGRPVAVASYLVGRGFFQTQAERAGGALTSAPLGAHPLLVDVVVEAYLRGRAQLG